ncbi:leucine-rich repeat-containing protein 34 isoform X2 [Petaurus breviceps papuanus]|uniref:leucine-rich repeat-containing protein 34 isoform X2 n=1 Tax=Petaurus breviceps papuanus TaxID=3040969 RepID=UPI0036DEE236
MVPTRILGPWRPGAAMQTFSFIPLPVEVSATFISLPQHYLEVCKSFKRHCNPFIYQTFLLLEKDYRKTNESYKNEITIKIAGNNRLIPVQRITDEDFETLIDTLRPHKNVTGLDVRYNLLTDDGAKHVAKLLEEVQSITYLNLMFNDIKTDGGEVIAKALHRNQTLKHLRLTGNKIENKGGMFFATMLQINSSLEKLDLGDCDLGMQSLIALATVLTTNHSIKGINLNRPILRSEEEESTIHMSHTLQINSTLIELHMCKHDIKNFGMQQLCKALYSNTALRYLDVSWLSIVSNNITGKGLTAFSDAMKTNTTLTNIYIWGNKFDSETCVAFSNLIKSGRLKPENTDVEPYVVDDCVYLAELSHGIKRHYYWTPSYGEIDGAAANAGLAIAPSAKNL